MTTAPRHVIVDRDGVLNEEAADGGYVLEPAGWRWVPGSLEALSMLTGAGIRVSVATNQSGVGRGLMNAAMLAAVHDTMLSEASAACATVAGVFACPHAPDEGCACRKPAAGLLDRAIAACDIAREHTLMAGDSVTDLEAARRAGVRAALVLTGKGRASAKAPSAAGIPVFEDLAGLAHAVVAGAATDFADHAKGGTAQ